MAFRGGEWANISTASPAHPGNGIVVSLSLEARDRGPDPAQPWLWHEQTCSPSGPSSWPLEKHVAAGHTSPLSARPAASPCCFQFPRRPGLCIRPARERPVGLAPPSADRKPWAASHFCTPIQLWLSQAPSSHWVFEVASTPNSPPLPPVFLLSGPNIHPPGLPLGCPRCAEGLQGLVHQDPRVLPSLKPPGLGLLIKRGGGQGSPA